MNQMQITDLTTNEELDREAMTAISGGTGFHGNKFPWGQYIDFDILSPDFINQVTNINGTANIPTEQTNNLVQSDQTTAINHGNGLNFVSNNKFASQSNSNWVGDFLNARVG